MRYNRDATATTTTTPPQGFNCPAGQYPVQNFAGTWVCAPSTCPTGYHVGFAANGLTAGCFSDANNTPYAAPIILPVLSNNSIPPRVVSNQIINGVPNLYLGIGAAVAAYFLFKD